MRHLRRRDCCQQNRCDETSILDRPLEIYDNLRNVFPGQIDFAGIRDHLDDGIIICGRINWANSGGHFIAIYGYEEKQSGQYLWVADPFYRTSLVRYDFVMNNFVHQGSWNITYITKPHRGAKPLLVANAEGGDLIHNAHRFVNGIRAMNYTEQKNAGSRHDVFVMDLNDLKSGAGAPRKVAVRFIDTYKEGESVTLEFNAGGWWGVGRLLQIIPHETFKEIYREPLALARQAMQQSDNSTLRLLRQANTKTESFWIRGNRKSRKDFFVPIFSSPYFDANTVYTRVEYNERLTNAASNYQIIDDDRRGG